MITVQEHSEPRSIDALAPDWNALASLAAPGSPFATCEWHARCLKHFGRDRIPVVLSVRDGERLLGIAPLWGDTGRVQGIRTRTLRFITCPDTPHVELVALPEQTARVCEAVVRHVAAAPTEAWDVLHLGPMPADSASRAAFTDAFRGSGWRYVDRPDGALPYIPLQRDWEEFLKSKPYLFRKAHRGIQNRLRRLEGLEVRAFHEDRGGELSADLLRVAERSWKHEKGLAMSSQPGAREFFADLTHIAGERRWLLVWLLTSQGVPIASEYDLVCGRKVYALRADFDEAFRQYSPGSYLEFQIVKHCSEQGFQEYVSGPGLTAYKLRWSDRVHGNVALRAYRTTPAGLTLWAWEARIRPALRRLKRLARPAAPEEASP